MLLASHSNFFLILLRLMSNLGLGVDFLYKFSCDLQY